MDGSTSNNNNYNNTSIPSSSSRRRLTKKPPSAHAQYQHRSSNSISNGVDAAAASNTSARFDALSIQSKRSSSASLRRAPSAPPARTSTSNNASNSSSPRYLPTSQQQQKQQPQPYLPSSSQSRSLNPSPTIPGAEFSAGLSFSSHPPTSAATHYRLSDPHSNTNLNNYGTSTAAVHRGLNSRASEEFIGAPFDGPAILKRIEATKSPSSPNRPTFPRTAQTTTDARLAGLSHRQSASFSAAADMMAAAEKSQGSRAADAQLSQSKRFSDETKEPRMASVLRKKSGFSGFMTSLGVGSPKKPTISAPENPVHVTHVGYDSTTGQFTVSSFFTCAYQPRLVHQANLCLRSSAAAATRASPRNGNA